MRWTSWSGGGALSQSCNVVSSSRRHQGLIYSIFAYALMCSANLSSFSWKSYDVS